MSKTLLSEQITQTDRGKVYWSRLISDNIPFRTKQEKVPFLREEEFEELTVQVGDTYYATFDTSKADQKLPVGSPNARTYSQVLEGIASGVFSLLYRSHTWHNTVDGPVMYVYIEWREQYLELASEVGNNPVK